MDALTETRLNEVAAKIQGRIDEGNTALAQALDLLGDLDAMPPDLYNVQVSLIDLIDWRDTILDALT
jgi:hypothetical protein